MNRRKTTKRENNRKKDILRQEENVFTMIRKGIRSPQSPLIVGVFLFLFAIFCFISFVSYFYTTITNYELVKVVSTYDLLTSTQNINNWGGNLGALLSHYVITHSFGFGSFGFLLIIILFSLRLLKISIPKFSKWIVSTLIIMLWISCVMGFIVIVFHLEILENFAGIVGVGINQILHEILGSIGIAITLLAFTITIPMLLFGVKYLWVQQVVQNISQHDTSNKEEVVIDKQGKPNEEGKNRVENRDDITTSSEIKQTNLSNIFKQENKEEKREKEGRQIQEEVSSQDKIQLNKLIHRSQSKYENNNSNMIAQDVELQSIATTPIQMQPQPIELGLQKEIIEKKEKDSNTENELINITSTQTKEEKIPFTVRQESNQSLEEKKDVPIEQMLQSHYCVDTPYNPYEELSHYVFPTTDLLIDYDKNNVVINERELLANKNRIVKTLLNYKIEISSIEATVGPTVTLYEIIPAPGIRISKIKSLEDDIALSLSALGIRIIAPIPGKGTIGIEVPNSKPQVVSMKSMLDSTQFLDNRFELPVAIGKRIDNTPYVADLTKMPHLLMAGATGQGKSVGLNAIISSLLYKKHPCDLKFIFVDPKKVELSLYSKLEKHYLAKVPNGKEAVITDVKDVIYTLRSLCQLMDTRYELLKEAGCKKITEYNKKFIAKRLNPERGHVYMPYVVLVIDEFADLIMTAGKEIEKPICRLAQLARAVGIHLIIATQRPSVNIITGTIKANFPARAAFKVSSLTDSRTILDTKGAEQLIGRGDMLISNGGPLFRLQCALIDTEEIENIADFIAEQQGFGECFLLPEIKEDMEEDIGEKKNLDDGKLDPLFEDAARLIVMIQQGSTSMLQRKLALGYNRAGRVMDQLESAGIVGPFRGSKARDVLVSSEEELIEILNNVLNG
ncbi:MAG: DNA translocase FtsK 4TM domain-containing protein [Bacteroidales bacterium]